MNNVIYIFELKKILKSKKILMKIFQYRALKIEGTNQENMHICAHILFDAKVEYYFKTYPPTSFDHIKFI